MGDWHCRRRGKDGGIDDCERLLQRLQVQREDRRADRVHDQVDDVLADQGQEWGGVGSESGDQQERRGLLQREGRGGVRAVPPVLWHRLEERPTVLDGTARGAESAGSPRPVWRDLPRAVDGGDDHPPDPPQHPHTHPLRESHVAARAGDHKDKNKVNTKTNTKTKTKTKTKY